MSAFTGGIELHSTNIGLLKLWLERILTTSLRWTKNNHCAQDLNFKTLLHKCVYKRLSPSKVNVQLRLKFLDTVSIANTLTRDLDELTVYSRV